MTYDDWKARGPHESLPSNCKREACACGRAVVVRGKCAWCLHAESKPAESTEKTNDER